MSTYHTAIVRETLTDEGRARALELAATSITARVALAGYASDWPLGHVSAAIRAMNEDARA